MKNFFIILLTAITLVSCGGGSSAEMERMRREIDSLKSLSADAMATSDMYFADINEIFESLQEVKRKQGIITQTSSGGGEIPADKKTLIQEDIMLIDQLMAENKEKLEALRNKIKKGDKKMAELEKTIANLQLLIDEKDQEIANLKSQLERLNIELENLSASYDKLALENASNKETIAKQAEELNTVYYTIGTFKELVDNKVLDKGGAFSVKAGAKLSADVNINYFTKADLRTLSEIKIGAKKVTLKTSHPQDSYKLETVNGKVEKLTITDGQKFWKNSKYCVIMIN
jgi:DNA repair exonuclease SbcCD ATPase subunit